MRQSSAISNGVGILLATLAAVAYLPAVAADLTRQIVFNIPAQPLAQALADFSRQSDVIVVAASEVTDGKLSKGVNATTTTEQALRQLLEGSDLIYTQEEDGSVIVTRPVKSFPPATPPSGSKTAASQDEPTVGSDQSNSKAASLEEVVVTAQKRTEHLIDIPASVTALSAEALKTQGVTDFNDYMTLVPGLADFSGGAAGHGAVILRALNTGYYQFSNTVGYYIDDTPFSATSPLSFGTFLTLDPDLTDIDHLEVLKGPQGTLYGATTLGGLIKVVTRKPDMNTNGGGLQLEGSAIDGGGSGYGLTGNGNLVIIPGELAVRVSGFDRETPGYMHNLTLDTKDRDLSRKKGGRISLRWRPEENLDIQLSAFTQSLFVNGWNYEFVNLQTLAPINAPYSYSLHYDPTFHTTYEVYNATVNYRVGSVGTLTNSTSYAKYNDHEAEDVSQYYGAYFNSYAPEPVPPEAAFLDNFGVSLKKITEELRFTSERLGGFEWIGGLFYTNERPTYFANYVNAIPPSVQPIPGPDGAPIGAYAPADYKEQAVFADLTYYIAAPLDLTVGGRYSRNQQHLSASQSGFAAYLPNFSNSSSDSDFTYLAALRWHPAENLNAYARIATSYRPGGPQNFPEPGYPLTFKADSLTNYEIGMKGEWFERKLRANIALYDMKWNDVQMTSNINGYSLISNGGKATVKGVELETQWLPVQRLTLGVNVAYTDAKLDSVSDSVSAATGAVAGNTLPFTPSWAASAVAEYVQPLNATLTATFGATYRYQGAKWSDYPADPLNTGVVIPHYSTTDIRAGVGWSRYQAQARLTNLFNSHGLDTVVSQRISGNPPAWAAIIQPRTFVLSFSADF